MTRNLVSLGLIALTGLGGVAVAFGSRPVGSSGANATALATTAIAGPFGLETLSDASRECVACHQKESTALYAMWGDSRHYRANVACFECHAAERSDPDALLHYDQYISVIVSPKDCARCHARQAQEFNGSHHSKGARILGSLNNVLAEVVEGNRAMKTPGFPGGNSAAAVSGCWQCHGSEVKVLPGGKLDPATWPNTGIGRINPDGSEGSCSACHTRHRFSVAQARHPDTCGRCHLGPDHPQKEIYEESKHGLSFFANIDRMNLESPKWIVGEDYSAAPTCTTCHMSATRNQLVTHDAGKRISWNNRPVISIRPEIADEQLGLPGAALPWEVRRENMKDVCLNCHNKRWVDNFYVQYDALIELYNEKFAKPGQDLYALAKPLLRPVEFGNKLDFIWYEIWHHEGRQARHGAAMMGPAYTHWHGTYEVAKSFYNEYIPALKALAQASIEEGLGSGDSEKVKAAEALEAKIKAVLNTDDHKWYLGKMDPEEVARRKRAAEEFRSRYAP
ncbi:MAG: multiheme c-type cytochrome [Planctomycetota bacterium]|jgi:hypothetical protein